MPIITASGEKRMISIKANKLVLDGKMLRVCMFRDITESKATERELERIQERFQGMFTHMASGVAVYEAVDDGADFIFKDFNPTAEKITRITREEAVGKRLLTLFPHMGKSGLLTALTKVWKTGQAVNIPPFHYKDDIREGWRENHIYKLPSGEVVALFNDVTDRMEAVNALRVSEERMELALNSVNDAVWDWNVRTGDAYFSPRWYTMLGYEPYELPSEFKTWETLMHPEDYERSIQTVRTHLNKGESFQLEFRMRSKSDGWRWIFARGRTVETDDQGVAMRMLGTHVDITERKQIEAALRESEGRFRAILENVDMVAVQGYDRDRRVIFWNRASEKLYGYSREEALGRRLEELIIPEPMRAEVIRFIGDWMEGGSPIPAGELDLMCKDGSLVPVYSSHVMQESADGEKTMYCVDIELAEIRKVHNQLLKAKEEAETANHAKSAFLANMSHEIRTPLNGVLGMLQLLETTDPNEEQNDYIISAINSSKRLTRLLSDILDISRVEAGRMTLVSEPMHLGQTFDQLEELFMPTVRQSNVIMSCRMHSGMRKQFLGDATRLQQVLNNLVGNAFKFTKSGSITVDAYPLPLSVTGKYRVLFSVSDTGCGIPDDKLDTLFKPFVQASKGLARTHQGAGLGLAISKDLVDLMGGNMAVETQVDVGTAIYFSVAFDIPEPDLQPVAQVISTEVVCDGVLNGLRILLAEDERVNSLVAAQLLYKAKAEVEIVEDGQQALEALRHGSFDVVLMDIQMPIMDGIEATKAIRQAKAGERNRRIPIIAMTAYVMAGDRERFLDAGMDGYLAKPVEVKLLHATICEALKGLGLSRG